MSTSREISRKCLKEDYKTVVCAANDEEAFMKQCIKWLENVEVFTCFQLLPFGDIKTGYLRESEKEKKPVKFDELESALKNMEKYAQNLLKKPWCKDFHTIKIFNGFFKYKIEKWIPLDTVCNILDSLGYEKRSEGIFEIKEFNEDKVLTIGLELCLAHTQLSQLKSTMFLGSYSVEDILDAWSETTGDPTKILEWLNQNHLTSSYKASKSDAVTTHTQCHHYDRNGHPTYQVTKNPDDLEHLPKNSAIDNMTSLPTPTSTYSDDQLYGRDEVEDKNGHLQSQEKQFSLNNSHSQGVKYPGKYNDSNEAYSSMPQPNSKFQRSYPGKKFTDDLLYRHHRNNLENLSPDQFYGSDFEEELKEDNSFIHSEKHTSIETRQPFVYKYSGENLVSEVKVNSGTSVSFGHQNITENLDKDRKKFQKILQDRVEAGEKDLQQQPKDLVEIIAAATDLPNLDQHCNVCDQAAVIGCEKCEATACKDCLKILKRKPCSGDYEHVYYCTTTKNKDSLYENVSSSQEHLGKREKYEDKIPCADSNKWQCKHCTVLNSPKTSVCATCDRTKDVKVQNPKPGTWQCSDCTFANPENVHICQTCKTKKGKHYSSIV